MDICFSPFFLYKDKLYLFESQINIGLRTPVFNIFLGLMECQSVSGLDIHQSLLNHIHQVGGCGGPATPGKLRWRVRSEAETLRTPQQLKVK